MKCTFHFPVKRRFVLFLLLTLSFAGFSQPENTIAAADKSIQQLGEWRIIGPFKDTIRNIGDSGYMKYAAQQGAQTIIDTIYHQEKDLIDLEALFKTNAKMIGYATCKVYSNKDQEMVFFINADDVMRFRINDSVAFTVPAYTHNEAVIRKGFLKKGVNILIAEINNTGGGNWGFDIDITTAENARHMATAFLSVIPKNSVTEARHSKVQLKNWKIIGPFSNTLGEIDENRLGYLQFIPQNAGRMTIDTLYQQGKEGVDLGNLLNTDMRGIAYAVCDVVSEEDQDLAFLVNVDDEIRLWKNNDLYLVVTGYTGGGAVIKKMNIKKGVSRLIAEIRNTGGGTWWFDINACSYDYIRDNALFPGFYLSSRKFIIPEGDNLYLEVADTDMVPVKNISTVKIYDARNKNCYTGCIDLKKDNKLTLPNLAAGAYRYELYTDRDTLTEYFCYGQVDKIYNREELTQKYKNNKTVYDVLMPYIKRLDRLLGDYSKSPNITLSKKLVYCIYKVKEIDSAWQHKRPADLNSTGLSLRTFTSAIELGDEHYLLYVPEKVKKEKVSVPLTVIVPYVTNNHPFYTGGIVANTDRVTYISKFAERYGMAVIWPSSRIFRWYNQTPIVTKAIIESIEDVCKHYNIDKKHIFLYGECSGGLFAFQTAIRRPDLFAAIAIEGAELGTVENAEKEQSGMLANNLFNLTENLYGKPLLVLHSGNDQKAPVNHSLRLMDSIKTYGWPVHYDDLNNLLRATYAKLYSEPEAMSKAFSFFNTQKKSRPHAVRKMATYGFYNDTVYGVLVKEKIGPGKATVSYQVQKDRLEFTTNNVNKLMIDTRKMDIKTSRDITIDLNGRRLAKGADYNNRGPVIELTSYRASGNGGNFTKEVHGPVNKVFLNTFALVRPAQAGEKVKTAIAVIDSLWTDEYRSHVQIIDEKKVDSAKRKGVNLIYFVEDIRQIAAPLLSKAAIEVKSDGLMCGGEKYRMTGSSFAFYFKDNNQTDNMYVGLQSTGTPSEMLKSIFIRKGWYDFEMWVENYPVIQYNYGEQEGY